MLRDLRMVGSVPQQHDVEPRGLPRGVNTNKRTPGFACDCKNLVGSWSFSCRPKAANAHVRCVDARNEDGVVCVTSQTIAVSLRSNFSNPPSNEYVKKT